jgi:AcrR family transcriptional regulator
VTLKREQNPRGSGDALREQLVAAASTLLLSPSGPAAPSLRAVAKAAGVSPTAVYLHFDSVRALVIEVINQQFDDLRAEYLAAPTLLDAARAYVRWGIAHPGAYQLLFESADRLGDDGPGHTELAGGPGWDMIEGIARQLFTAGLATAETALPLSVRVWTTLHGLTSLRIHKAGLAWPTEIDDEVAALLAAFL